MPTLSNQTRSPLALPKGAGTIPPGGTLEVSDDAWASARSRSTVRSWVDGGALVVRDETPEEDPIAEILEGKVDDIVDTLENAEASDIHRALELERAKDKPRKGLISKLEALVAE